VEQARAPPKISRERRSVRWRGRVALRGYRGILGEWEAPSYVKKEWPPQAPLPRFLHTPVWEHPTDSDPRQNTDPWVFGDCFRYSNCRQPSQPALRTLTRGSVIIFGSSLSGNFVVDTVFVVTDSCPFSPADPPETDDAFRVCTVESLLTDEKYAGNPFTLYWGATYEASINGMYSFVPCRRADAQKPRFPRPLISLPGQYLNPRAQAPKGAGQPRSLEEVRQQWENVRKQIQAADCLLGVHFSTPNLDQDLTNAA
jgi:hypothetical protein